MSSVNDAMRAAIVAEDEHKERAQSDWMLGMVMVTTALFWAPLVIYWLTT